ncbi:DnaJ domain protein [Trichuris suis]|nr:DnaJ domain protein [Trichuris suis]KHJ45178.1 DnaJ domain protein [Trichuris suis]
MAEGIVEESLAKALVCLNVRASAWRPEPAGISFESKVIRDLVNYGRNFYACTGEKLDSLLALSVYERCEYLTKPVSTEEDVDVTAFDSNDDPSYIEYLATLDPTQWKNQDQYRVLGLSKLRYRASYPQIRASYRCKALLFHPDKRSSCAGETQVLTDDMFTCVTRAYETLSNPKTRLSYDCVDPENDDSVPPVCQNSRDNFFEIFADAFNRNSRWCSAPSVPQLGNPDDSEQQVNAFYSFWFEFPSWREFSWLDEENKATAESREERRWIEKMNRAARESHRKAEAKRIRTLVENAYKCDPRIKRFKEEEKKRREAIKEKKRLAKRQLEEEQLKLKAEETERQRKEKEAEEERVRQRVAEERRQKDAAKRALQREKKFLSDFVKERGYFASANFDQLAIMNDLGRLCSLMPLERLQSLNSSLKASTDVASSANCFRTFVNELDERLNAEKNYAAQSSSKTQGNDGESFDDPSWTKEETQLLVRAMRLFPAGTKSRWETIATFINEHKKYEAVRGAKTGKQVAAMAKRLQKVADDAKDTIADGNPLQAKGTVRAESSPTVRCDEKGKGNLLIVGILFVKLNFILPVADNKTESAASGTEIAPRAWTSDEQKLLEEGLKIYPSTLANRWDLIAERLPNRSKRECINRYKEIAEIVRAKKAALQKHSNGLR